MKLNFIGTLLRAVTPLLFITGYSLVYSQEGLNEAKVFEWWDDGIIDGDEAREILEFLEEGNQQEACLLASIYALEPCPDETPAPKKAKAKKGGHPKNYSKVSLIPHGFVKWKGRTDSLGHLESHRTEIHLEFYRYTLQLGTQSLLTYKNQGSEAYFGQISTQELHSAIPLDTLWGAALLYPFGMFRVGALLDTATTLRGSLGLTPSKKSLVEIAYWHSNPNKTYNEADSVFEVEEHSISLLGKGDWGSISAWWMRHENIQSQPLVKLQLHHREKFSSDSRASVSWKTTAYFHGDSVPRQARLSATLQKHRFWGNQVLGISFPDSWNSKIAASARIMLPLENDSTKARLKINAESGPPLLRGGASGTCLEAAPGKKGKSRCRQNDLALFLNSQWDLEESASHKNQEQLVLGGTLRTRHTRGQGFGTPRLEAHASFAADRYNFFRLTFALPKGNPRHEFQIRSEAQVGLPYLRFSMAATFRNTPKETLHPLHGYLETKILF